MNGNIISVKVGDAPSNGPEVPGPDPTESFVADCELMPVIGTVPEVLDKGDSGNSEDNTSNSASSAIGDTASTLAGGLIEPADWFA